MKYYGIFTDLIKLAPLIVKDIDLYEGYFAERYDRLIGMYPQEIDYYRKSACVSYGKILELACGTGRITLELAKIGFEVKGIELSNFMIQEFEKKIKRCRANVRNLITYEKADVWSYETDEKYGLIILPATTICYFIQKPEETVRLFERLYGILEDGGRFVFDYRIDQQEIFRKESKLQSKYYETKEEKEFLFMQEFDNHKSGYSIVNFYAEKIVNGITERYMTSSTKKIVTDQMMKNIIEKTRFHIIEEEVADMGDNVKIKYITLQKGANDEGL